jgi:hypothetical protein
MSLFENDYIKRLVQQFAELNAALAGMKREQRIDEALEEMREAYGRILATDGEMLHMIDPASAARLLNDPKAVATYVAMLRQEAELYRILGETARADRLAARAAAIEASSR